MKIGYGTYAIPNVPIEEALPRAAAMGYESVEICCEGRWPTAPGKLSPADRGCLRERLGELDLEMPAVMLFLQLLAPEGEELERQEGLFRDACTLARDLTPHPERAPAPV